MDFTEKLLDSKMQYQGRLLALRTDTVLLPNGKEAQREICEHPGGVAVLAIDDQGRCALVRQYRHAFSQDLYEIPAGKLDKGDSEDHLSGALRELREEVGATPSEMTYLGPVYLSPGCFTEVLHLYLATGLRMGGQVLDEDEFLQVSWVSMDELREMIRLNEIRDAKTLAALLFYDLKGEADG